MKSKIQTGACSKETEYAIKNQVPFPDEIAHLAVIRDNLNVALEEANASVNRIDKDYMDTKRYMAAYRGELDPHEMFQNELALKGIDRTGAFAVGIKEKLDKMKDSPYFARIDFQEKGVKTPEKYYIGRFTFRHENEIYIFDWRAPLASMFYDFEVGLAHYCAPAGIIEGSLTRKRQFKIKNGTLEYALESSVNIQDDVLQKELSHTSDKKMKSIISTIQKEQNQIIRNENAVTLIIQGVAGSGKTSIALHRIAFLLYRFRNTISARNVAILSPNKVFGDYISTVLPELGEEPICEFSFVDIAKVQLKGIVDFELDKDPLETADDSWKERIRFKSTLNFVNQMDEYLQKMNDMIFKPSAYSFARFTVSAEWIRARFSAYQSFPIKKRLELIANDIHDRLVSENFMDDEMPKSRIILKKLNSMLIIKNSLTLYKNFYKWLGAPDMFMLPAKSLLEWADVYPFLYLHAAFSGLHASEMIKHLVIDEMQDYTPIQYAVINLVFPCRKTILGDFGQCANPNHLHTLEDLQRMYHDGNFLELSKSYRSTYEIISFAKGIKQAGHLEPIERHGDAPLLISCKNKQDEVVKIKKKLHAFLKSENVSLGIISKTNSAARLLYKLLAEEYVVQLISPDSTDFTDGISITSIQMSKGLEFDEVIVPDVSDDTYRTEYDRSLLYIATTRAMHRLTLLYSGKPSRFLSQ